MRSKFEDTRRKAIKFGANGSTHKAYKPARKRLSAKRDQGLRNREVPPATVSSEHADRDHPEMRRSDEQISERIRADPYDA
jgi:hypothetical protein